MAHVFNELWLQDLTLQQKYYICTSAKFHWPFKKWTSKTSSIADRGQQPFCTFVLKNDLPSLFSFSPNKKWHNHDGDVVLLCVWWVVLLYFRTSLEMKCEIYNCVLEPHSMDSPGHQHRAKKLSPEIALHLKWSVKVKQNYLSFSVWCWWPWESQSLLWGSSAHFKFRTFKFYTSLQSVVSK